MDRATKLKFELAAAWAGVVFIALYPPLWAGIGKAQPPLGYHVSPEKTADFYLSNDHRIMLGMALAAVVGGLWIPWTGQLTTVLRRIEGEGAVFTTTQLIGGVLTAWAFIGTPIIWLLPAFQGDADPQVIRAFSNYAYLLFNGTFIISTMQAVPAGLIGLADRSEHPVFPRWACWVAIVAGLGFGIVGFTTFVHSGPFALEGWFAGWFPGTGFFVWTATTTYCMIKDARRRQRLSETEPVVERVLAAGRV